MIWLILGIVLAVIMMMGGGGWFIYEQGIDKGKAVCEAAHEKADAELKLKADKYEQEAANHIQDMATAADVAEQEGYQRGKREQQKGAKYVAASPQVFGNTACVVPPDALDTLNAARSGFRRDVPIASGLPNNSSDSSSTSVGSAPSAAAPTGTVRGTGTTAQGVVTGSVPADVGGRRPLGKVRP